MAESITLTTADGTELGASLYAASQPRGMVVIGGAMAVKQTYYAAFATWLQEQGLSVLTLDWRGTGRSAPERLRGYSCSMLQFGSDDLPAALDCARQRAANLPIYYVGHSVGGQVLGMAPNRSLVKRAVFVASQSGYWRHWDGASKLGMMMLWYVLIPGITALLGYWPGKRLGMGEDQPSGIVRSWAWCGRHPEYLLGRMSPEQRDRYDAFEADVHVLSFADDGYAPRRAAGALAGFYQAAGATHEHQTPEAFGVARIGHFGAFRSSMQEPLWPYLLTLITGDEANRSTL